MAEKEHTLFDTMQIQKTFYTAGVGILEKNLWHFMIYFTLLIPYIFYIVIYHPNQNFHYRIRNRKTLSLLPYIFIYFHCLHSVLTYPLIFSLSLSLFFMLYCTHIHAFLHIYIHYWLDSINEKNMRLYKFTNYCIF